MIEGRERLASTPAREIALECLEVGIAASDPRRVLRNTISFEAGVLQVGDTQLDLDRHNRVIVVGGGKASGEQARALETMLGDRIDDGLVVTPETIDLERIDVRKGDHPLPSERAVEATSELLLHAEAADADTLVLALLTGGGSALLAAPASGISLEALQTVTEELLTRGATIQELNTVRKHLSKVKGGGLARAAAPATVLALVMSDVVGDDPSVIASGPTAPDSSTFADAVDVLARYDVQAPNAVKRRLEDGIAGRISETPGPGDPVFESVHNELTADSATPIRAAMGHLESTPYRSLFLSSRIRGEASEVAKGFVAIGEEIRVSGHPVDPPAVVLAGGETTVTLDGEGRGGPNQEFALSAGIEGAPGLTVAAVDTDGIDGASPAAGGIVDAETVDDLQVARAALTANDAYPYLRARCGSIETGPTGTNVNDFRVMVVEPLAGERG